MIEIENFIPTDKGVLKGKFTIRMEKWGGFLIHGVSLLEKDGKKWVSMPQHKIQVQGEDRWVPTMLYDKPDVNRKFLANILEALEVHLMKV